MGVKAQNPVLPGMEGYAGRNVLLGAWDTHPEVARVFVRWAKVMPDDLVLEPSVGIGNIAHAIIETGAHVTACEIDAARAEVSARRLGIEVRVADFLCVTDMAERVTLACMNPPYEKDGETRHMLHALTFAPRVCAIVRLVALASAARAASWRSVSVTRLAVLVPRPTFAATSGMDEIAFVEIERGDKSQPTLEWLAWR